MLPIDIMVMKGGSPNRASLSDFSGEHIVINPEDASVTVTVNNDGSIYLLEGLNETIDQDWLDSGLASVFEVMVSPISGSFSSGTNNTWLSLSTDRSWGIVKPSIGVNSVTAMMYIRRVGETSPHTQCSFTLTANVEF